MGKYATNTNVTSEKSRMEIERTLQRYGASQFMYGWQDEKAVVGFTMNSRMVRFVLAMPDYNSDDFKLTPTGKTRSENAQREAYEQAVRQRWRALSLVVKAKLEAVESDISTFEEEFLANIVLPDNSTVAQNMIPQIASAYKTGKMPKLLPWGNK